MGLGFAVWFCTSGPKVLKDVLILTWQDVLLFVKGLPCLVSYPLWAAFIVSEESPSEGRDHATGS